jgi:hypothetical protein
MRKIDNKTLNKYVDSLSNQRRTFIVENKRKVNSILINGKASILNKGKPSAIKNKKKNREVINLISQVAKNVNQHIVDKGLVVSAVRSRHSSTYTNRKMYREMAEGERFYYVDISHCFWRIAFLKKYITKQLYENTLKKDEFKAYRNIALACIVAPRSRKYYVFGEFMCEISEWKVFHQRIYDNIRYTAYNLMGDIRAEINRYCIGYRTDGIMITDNPRVLKRVQEIITKKGFSYTVTECYKQDELFYQYGDNDKKKRM